VYEKTPGFTQSCFDPAARFRFIQLIRICVPPAGRGAPPEPADDMVQPLEARLLRGAHYRRGERDEI